MMKLRKLAGLIIQVLPSIAMLAWYQEKSKRHAMPRSAGKKGGTRLMVVITSNVERVLVDSVVARALGDLAFDGLPPMLW